MYSCNLFVSIVQYINKNKAAIFLSEMICTQNKQGVVDLF